MKQQAEEFELRMEILEKLESLYNKEKERRNALHSDVKEMMENVFTKELYPDLDFSVFVSLKKEFLSKDEIRDIQNILTIIFNDLKNAGHEYLRIGMLLNRWIIFHKEMPSPRQ